MPLWTGNVIPGGGRWVHRHVERHGDHPIRRWSKDAPDLKCNVPCQTCNGGWMAHLEERAKPILTSLILGQSSRLELHNLELISFWALKTCLMLDRCSEAQRQNIPASEFVELYLKQSVLPSAHVWVGKCHVARGSWFQARTLDLDTGDGMTRGYGATLWVGHVVFQLISIGLSGSVKVGLKPDVMADLAPIWPRSFKLDWPATPALSLTDVVHLGDRIAASGLRLYPD